MNNHPKCKYPVINAPTKRSVSCLFIAALLLSALPAAAQYGTMAVHSTLSLTGVYTIFGTMAGSDIIANDDFFTDRPNHSVVKPYPGLPGGTESEYSYKAGNPATLEYAMASYDLYGNYRGTVNAVAYLTFYPGSSEGTFNSSGSFATPSGGSGTFIGAGTFIYSTPPTISTITDPATNEDSATAAIPFTVNDWESATTALTVTGYSSNLTLVPRANIVIGGSGADRTVTIIPAANQSGTATITLTVSDGGLSTSASFVVTVNAVNDAPTITIVANQTTDEDTATAAIPFTIGDAETPVASLTVTCDSFNPPLVPPANIILGGSGANRTVAIIPAANQSGTVTITLIVSDGELSASASFVLTVLAVPAAPEIAIEQSAVNIDDGGTQTFGTLAMGGTADLVFTIRSIGLADLMLSGTPKVAVSGTDAALFTVITPPASPVSGPNGSTTFTVRFSPTSTGAKSAALHIASNVSGAANPFDINLTGTGATAAAVFNNFVSTHSSLSGSAALPDAIPFNDGVKNLLKYAFNMNLAGSDSHALTADTGTAGLPTVALTGTGATTELRLEFLRRIGSGLIYTPEVSSDLTTFSPLTGTTAVTSIDDQWERVVVRQPSNPATTPARFGRVVVTLP